MCAEPPRAPRWQRPTWRALLLALSIGAASSAPAAGAESFHAAQQGLDQRLAQSLEELAKLHDRIAREKIPLSKEIAGLEEEVLALRQRKGRLLEERDARTIDLSSLRKEVENLRSQEEFASSRLNEFVRDFEGRLHISELPRYESLTAAAKLSEQRADLDAEGARTAQLAVVEAAMQRLRDQLGGHVFEGAALDAEGVLVEGRFVALGPSVFFASKDGEVAGLVENRLNAADPVVVALPGVTNGNVSGVASAGKGLLPLDATLGRAVKVAQSRDTLREHVAKGGAIGYVILLLGLGALGLAVFKCIEILGFRVAAAEQVDSVLEELSKGNQQAAVWQAGQVEGIAGRMLATGVEHAEERREVLEELLFEKILVVRPTLERYLPFLAITAAAAPLLGLLGTVTGMIKTFQLLTLFGTGDAKSLSSGISEALVTTELGLMVAIPALIVHGALSRMAKHKLGLLEQLMVAFVNGVASIRLRPRPAAARGA
jgi:biopolymer transport protein ExbB